MRIWNTQATNVPGYWRKMMVSAVESTGVALFSVSRLSLLISTIFDVMLSYQYCYLGNSMLLHYKCFISLNCKVKNISSIQLIVLTNCIDLLMIIFFSKWRKHDSIKIYLFRLVNITSCSYICHLYLFTHNYILAQSY